MPPPSKAEVTGGRLAGEDMNMYMESFAEKFLKGRFRFHVEILSVTLNPESFGYGWMVSFRDIVSGIEERRHFEKIVACTGGCSEPFIPEQLATQLGRFQGPVCHSSEFKAHASRILAAPPAGANEPQQVVVVGGGKSAQDIAAQLTNQGCKVSMVFESTDGFLANSTPSPGFIRKSRFLGILPPHIELRSKLERFLHSTRIGGAIVRGLWSFIRFSSFKALNIPTSSPLRNAHSIFWSIRINDEGVSSPDRFHELVSAGRIDLISPARVVSFGEDGRSVVLSDGTRLPASAVVLATGFRSSWKKIFDEPTMEAIGLARHPPSAAYIQAPETQWDYTSFKDPPPAHAHRDQSCSAIYRGIVPAKSIFQRNFAVNGGIFSTNNGYTWEVAAHWISSYFLNDTFLRLPLSIGGAHDHAERNAAWLRKRFPDMLLWANDCNTNFVFFTWPQACDELLDDMGLSSQRSGGNWMTWLFKVTDVKEIENLEEERRAKRIVSVPSGINGMQ